jgi:ribosome-associated protein
MMAAKKKKKTAARSAGKPAAKKSTQKKKAPAKKAAAKKSAARKPTAKRAAAKPSAAKAAPKKTSPKKATRAAAPAAVTALPQLPVDPTEELAQALGALASDKKAEDIVVLKVTDLTSYADCFVLASAPSERQVQAIARYVDEEMKKAGRHSFGTEGLEQGHWVLVDYGAVVLHVFLSSARQYYDLEGFWSDAPRIGFDEARGKRAYDALRAASEQRAAANE